MLHNPGFRVVKSSYEDGQWIDTQEYDLEYGYNLAGQMMTEKYPSGKIITNSFDANGRLSGIADASQTYLSGLQYQGNGGSLSSMSYGNGTTQTFTLNDRMQMTNQTLSKGSDILQKYDYGFGQINGSGTLDTTKNNGQLSQIDSYIGTNKQWTQKFSYDSIGRLSQSAEYRGDNSSLTYKQTFDFDRFGNMYRKSANNATTGQANPLLYTPIEDTDISKSTNRFTTNTSYDDAGNVVTDNKFRTTGFGYDANGRMVKATRTSAPDALSVYDSIGMRVAEKVNDVWRFLVYDIGGKLVAEYGGTNASDVGGVKYLMSDWQGSTRAIVNSTGFVTARSDYTAYGEDIGAGTGQRSIGQGFVSATTPRQKYGLTERDDATGLDTTWFRKHENRAGRWTSPDPYNGSAKIVDPQSFNRYSYVESQPTDYVDPSGLLREGPGRIITQDEFCRMTGLGCGNSGHGFDSGNEDWGGGGGGISAIPANNKNCLDGFCNPDCLRKEERKCAEKGKAKFNRSLSVAGVLTALIGARTLFQLASMSQAEIVAMVSSTLWWMGGGLSLGLALYGITQNAVAVEDECRDHIPDKCGEGCKKYLGSAGRA